MELILVLAVVSMVLALATPTLRGFFASRQTADAAAAMLSLTRWAQSQAICQGRTYRLNVDGQAGEFWLTGQEGGAFVELTGEMGRRFQLPEGAVATVRCESAAAPDCVGFYPNGRTDVATIELVGRGGEAFLVKCESAAEPFRVISESEAE